MLEEYFTPYEIQVIKALINAGKPMTPSEISKKSLVPRTKVYKTLRSLHLKRIVEPLAKVTDISTFLWVISPHFIDFLKTIKQRLNDDLKEIEQMENKLNEYFNRIRKTEKRYEIRVVKPRIKIKVRKIDRSIVELLERLRKEDKIRNFEILAT